MGLRHWRRPVPFHNPLLPNFGSRECLYQLTILMSLRKKKLPWRKEEYVILEEHNEVWLRGSFMRAMAAQHMSEDYGYKILMASQDFIDRLRQDPSLRNDTWYVKQLQAK